MVQQEFNFFTVGETSHVDLFTFATGPIPVWKQVQNRRVAPPTFVIVVIVFGKSAQIHHAKVRRRAGPFVRDRLAAVVKAGPDERAGEPVARGEEFPPILRGRSPLWRALVIPANISTNRIIRMKSARADAARFFRSYD